MSLHSFMVIIWGWVGGGPGHYTVISWDSICIFPSPSPVPVAWQFLISFWTKFWLSFFFEMVYPWVQKNWIYAGWGAAGDRERCWLEWRTRIILSEPEPELGTRGLHLTLNCHLTCSSDLMSVWPKRKLRKNSFKIRVKKMRELKTCTWTWLTDRQRSEFPEPFSEPKMFLTDLWFMNDDEALNFY